MMLLMRIIFAIGVILYLIYQGYIDTHKSGSTSVQGQEPHAERYACPDNLTAEQVSAWAKDAAVKAFHFNAEESPETSSDRTLFSKAGWRNFDTFLQTTGLFVEGRLNTTNLGANSLSLQISGEPVTMIFAHFKSSGEVKLWTSRMRVTISPASAHLPAETDLALNLSCENTGQVPPLSIEAWIMTPAQPATAR